MTTKTPLKEQIEWLKSSIKAMVKEEYALALSDETIYLSIKIAKLLPLPYMFPTSRQGINLEWRLRNGRAVLWIHKDHSIDFVSVCNDDTTIAFNYSSFSEFDVEIINKILDRGITHDED